MQNLNVEETIQKNRKTKLEIKKRKGGVDNEWKE